MGKVWSTYQCSIFDFMAKDSRNGIVEAMPGSGKTTVLEECVRRLPEISEILAMTFTCLARDQLKEKLKGYQNVTVVNLNGFGNSCIKGYKKVNKFKVANIFKYKVLDMDNYTKEKFIKFSKHVGAITRLIGLLKSQMVFTDDDFQRNWKSVAEQYDVDLPDELAEFEDYLWQTYRLDRAQYNPIDFDDQIAIPIRDNLAIRQFPYVLVDETQDLTPCQIELTKRAIEPDGRGLYVGDRNQSVYFFRGADSKAMDNIKLSLDAVELPLSICYRCSKAVVREAQGVVPGIEFHEDAVEGSVSDIDLNDFREQADKGDFGLCRTTAPLVKECLWFIRNGKPARVKGREIGEDMCRIVNEISKNNEKMGIEPFLVGLRAYYDVQVEKLKKMDRVEKRILLDDKIDTIMVLCENSNTVGEVLKRFEEIFTDMDEKGVVMLMTGHKAKGLETKNVFILRPDLIPHKLSKSEEALTQERNLKFVMITRAQVNLYWVHGGEAKTAEDEIV